MRTPLLFAACAALLAAAPAMAGDAKVPEKVATCAACHGADGKGNAALGAPNLTDRIWLHGSAEPAIIETITRGRTNQMPAHKDFLSDAKIHILTAYVLSLSQTEK